MQLPCHLLHLLMLTVFAFEIVAGQQNCVISASIMIRLIIADDHTIMRQGIRLLIEHAEDIELVAECGDGVTALELIELHRPDVAILDIAMPQLDGLALSEKLIREQRPVAVIILTSHEDSLLHQQAMNIGIKHFVPKTHAFELLLNSIRQAASSLKGEPASSSGQCNDLNTAPFRITDREKDVLRLIAHGMTNRMIAEHLDISIKTVDRHRTNLMTKLNLHSAAQLSRFALQTGLY